VIASVFEANQKIIQFYFEVQVASFYVTIIKR